MKTYKPIFIFLLFVSLLFFGKNFAFALGTKISPIRIDKLVIPGETLTEKIKIGNVSHSSSTYYFYISDFRAANETGGVKLVSPGSTKKYSLASWIKITKKPINLGPGEEKEIPFKIEIPKESEPGGYYGAIIAATIPPKVKKEEKERAATIAMAQQTACLVILQIAGNVNESAMIREFSSDKNFYSTPFKVKLLTRVKDLGNVHIKPQGIINIKNTLGKKIATLEVNKLGSNVLPNTIRRFENTWEGNMGFGKYTASLVLSFGTPVSVGGKGRQSLYAETSFWILPWRIIIPSAIGLALFLALFILFLRFYKSAAVKKALAETGFYQLKYIRKPKTRAFPLFLILILIFLAFLLIAFLIYFLLLA